MTYETRRLLAEAEEEVREECPPDEDMSHCGACGWPANLCQCGSDER